MIPFTWCAICASTARGLLRGTWETAEGGDGQLLFRPVQFYSNFVVGQNVVQISRTFTALGTGRHVVRFRVQEPDLLSDQTEIQYYVGLSPDQVSAAELPSPLSILNPAPNSITETGLEISWASALFGSAHRNKDASRCRNVGFAFQWVWSAKQERPLWLVLRGRWLHRAP